MKKIFIGMAILLSINIHADEASTNKECNNGNIKSCLLLGDKQAKEEKFNKAKNYFEKACTLNSGEGCFKLGGIYMFEQDYSNLMTYSKKSCDLNNANGCTLLGIAYDIQGDSAEAIKAHKKACEGGSEMGCTQLSMINKNLEKTKKSSICPQTYYNEYLIGYKEMNGKEFNQENLQTMIFNCDEINKNNTFEHAFSCKLGGTFALGKHNKLSCENFNQQLEINLKMYREEQR